MYVCLLFSSNPFLSFFYSLIRSHLISFRPVYSFLRASAPLHKRNKTASRLSFTSLKFTSFRGWTRSATRSLSLHFFSSFGGMRVRRLGRRHISPLRFFDLAVCLSYIPFILIARASVKLVENSVAFSFLFLSLFLSLSALSRTPFIASFRPAIYVASVGRDQ